VAKVLVSETSGLIVRRLMLSLLQKLLHHNASDAACLLTFSHLTCAA